MLKLRVEFRNFANASTIRQDISKTECVGFWVGSGTRRADSRELWKSRLCILSIQGDSWSNGDAQGAAEFILFFFWKTI